MRFLYPGGIGIGKCWFIRREEYRRTRRKLSDQVDNQQQTWPTYGTGPEIEPGWHWWEASALTTAFQFSEILSVIRCFSYFFSCVFTVLPSSVGEQGHSTSSWSVLKGKQGPTTPSTDWRLAWCPCPSSCCRLGPATTRPSSGFTSTTCWGTWWRGVWRRRASM